MLRDEFFRAILKHFYYEFVKEPSAIHWSESFSNLTINIKTHVHDCIVRIYPAHYVMISSSGKGPFSVDNFDIEEFKLKYSHLSDNNPF